jgi:hypothetical protein
MRSTALGMLGAALLSACFGSHGDDANVDVDAREIDAPNVDAPIDAVPITCPTGYTQFENSCYRALDSSALMTWFFAEAACENDAAHLAVVDNDGEGNYLRSIAGDGDFWVGITDHLAEGAYRHVTGQPITFADWAASQPDNAGNREDCVAYLGNGLVWSDRPCTDEMHVVCEYDGMPAATPATYCDTESPTSCGACGNLCPDSRPCVAQVCEPAPPNCPVGYVRNNDTQTCFRLGTTPSTWQNAELDCEDDTFQNVGSHLAVVESATERDYLNTLAAGSYWIGLSDHDQEGRFVWVTGALPVFADWTVGEPNDDFNTEDCGEYRAGSLRRNDRTCSFAQRYMCEWDGTAAAMGGSQTWCDTSTASDCGACGNACPSGQACNAQYCQPSCPTGYAGAIGSCYKTVTNPLNWQQAEAACEADTFMGIAAHMAVVGSVDERTYLDAQMSGSYWIGLSDHDAEGTFRWVTGAALTFVDWTGAEPNNDFNTEDCGEYREVTDRWNDRTCTATQGYVCEWDSTPPATGNGQTWCDTDTTSNCGTCGNACVPVVQACTAQRCTNI